MQCLRILERPLRISIFASIASVAIFAQESTPQPLIQPGTLPEKGAASEIQPPEKMPDFPLATPVEASPGSAPIDFHGQTDYFIKSLTSRQSVGRIVLTTGFRSLTGSGNGSYAEDFGTRYAEHLTKRSVQFAIGAFRGEDPRFRRSGEEGFWDRTKFVLSRTVLTDMANGGTSIAVGKLTGSFAGNTLSSYMRTNRPDPLKNAFIDTGVNLGTDLGFRMVREFWPEIKGLFRK